jgi:hypothetical protein
MGLPIVLMRGLVAWRHGPSECGRYASAGLGVERFEGIALTGDESGRDRRSRLYACPGDGTPAVQALNKFIPTRSLAPAGGRVDA